MKELTTDEKILTGKLWDAGYGIHGIAIIIHNKRAEMDDYYLAEMVAEELKGKVSIDKEGGD